ncbi:hypothetical protein CS542_10740 [Pedobacter sp. IW39]|nr:hypothetical protein CS542_10740 [Pedobacter sp. IW39]
MLCTIDKNRTSGQRASFCSVHLSNYMVLSAGLLLFVHKAEIHCLLYLLGYHILDCRCLLLNEYILLQYKEWYLSLSAKQLENATLVSWQDISLME